MQNVSFATTTTLRTPDGVMLSSRAVRQYLNARLKQSGAVQSFILDMNTLTICELVPISEKAIFNSSCQGTHRHCSR